MLHGTGSVSCTASASTSDSRSRSPSWEAAAAAAAEAASSREAAAISAALSAAAPSESGFLRRTAFRGWMGRATSLASTSDFHHQKSRSRGESSCNRRSVANAMHKGQVSAQTLTRKTSKLLWSTIPITRNDDENISSRDRLRTLRRQATQVLVGAVE